MTNELRAASLHSADADTEPSANASAALSRRGASGQTRSTSTYPRCLKAVLNSVNPFGRSPMGDNHAVRVRLLSVTRELSSEVVKRWRFLATVLAAGSKRWTRDASL
jgi:hypothetical protein